MARYTEAVCRLCRREGMKLFDDSLKELVDEGAIEGVEAYNRAISKQQFEQYNTQ